ncbi:lysozyme [Erythrobacteraceae bacterium WH01K]|nr:lysozyme [Erythrobacteraceae bacterium WH01K]
MKSGLKNRSRRVRESWRGGSLRGVPVSLAAAGMALATIGNTAPSSATLNAALAELADEFSYDDMAARNAEVMRINAAHITSSEKFKQALVEEEGVRYTVYRDVAGYPTVGVGHLVLPEDNLSVGDTISHERAMQFLTSDLKKAEVGVVRLLDGLNVYQHEFDALVDLVFNVGEGGVSESRSPRLNTSIANADYGAIADELNYTTAGGAVAGGLIHRSERRAAIFMDANYENPRPA